ncbi:MAG TPA: prepilin-type N-terminal cleavage/methylation domain-containing protein [Polyangiales bacterium]|nr:prepilin-type N-terminal cleavage/methylation domain-containing protein [Polyangiales bacterium]
MKRARSTEGFTLLEMAIVVLIMGSMAAMIAPGLSEWMADARASGAAEDMVRISRVVRARVNSTGLAHVLVFRGTTDTVGSNGLGNVRVWEGMNNHCNQTPWLQTIKGKIEDGHSQIDGLDLVDSAYNLPTSGSAPSAADTGRQVIVLTCSLSEKTAVLCFEPNGATFVGVDQSGSADIGYRFTPQTAPVIFTVTRYVHGGGDPKDETRGLARQIVFPVGGNGRLRF